MRRCLNCDERFGSGWSCPRCRYAPERRSDDVLVFEHRADDGFEGEYFEELAGVEAGNFWFRSRSRLIAWMVRSFAGRAESFLEVGCGNGFVLSGMRSAFPGLRLEGAELFDEGLAMARSRLADIALYKLDARRLPFDTEYDAIGLFDVLEHIAEDDVVLREVLRSLTPGGTLFLSVPQHRWLWSAADEYARHVRRYTRPELLGKVREAGYDVVHTTSFMTLLLPLLLVSRVRRRRLDADYDALAELALPSPVNRALEFVTTIELALTRLGLDWRFGGSLMLVARRPPIS